MLINKNKDSSKEIENLEKKRGKVKFDFIMLLALMLISSFGVLIVYSATRYSMPGGVGDPQYYMKRHAMWAVVGFVLFILAQLINYRKIKKYWWVVFTINIFALISVLFIGYDVHGSKSWIDLKFFSIQPSEFSKILMVILVSTILSEWRGEKKNKVGFKKVILSLLVVFTSIVLVALEPDLGTALIYFLVYAGMLFVSGANFLYILGLLGLSCGGVFFGLKIGLIKEYQLNRILVFVKPEAQKEGIGYNLFQSKLAIGSGKLWGKGLFLGKQTNLSYVPEHHTDFIFSVIGEELGFFGALLIVLVLGLIVWRCFYIAINASDRFGALLSAGIGFIILSQMFINIGMTMGIMPIIGIPLPFLSYGGSSLISIFIGLGLVENVYLRREVRKDYEIAYQDFY